MTFTIYLSDGSDEKIVYENVSHFKLSDGVLALYREDNHDNNVILAIIPLNSILYVDISHST